METSFSFFFLTLIGFFRFLFFLFFVFFLSRLLTCVIDFCASKLDAVQPKVTGKLFIDQELFSLFGFICFREIFSSSFFFVVAAFLFGLSLRAKSNINKTNNPHTARISR